MTSATRLTAVYPGTFDPSALTLLPGRLPIRSIGFASVDGPPFTLPQQPKLFWAAVRPSPAVHLRAVAVGARTTPPEIS